MLEESLDPRPSLPVELSRILTGSPAPGSVPVEVFAQAWNDNASLWSNLRTVEYWIHRTPR